MVEAIVSIITTVVESIIKSRLKRRERSASKALYFMYLSVNVIIDEAEKILSLIDAKSNGEKDRYTNEFTEHLLEIYKQTQIFLDNTSYIDDLIKIFDPKRSDLTKMAYRFDMDLFGALDSMISTIKWLLKDEGKIVDFNPFLDPKVIFSFEMLPFESKLDKIREDHNIQLIEINNLDALMNLHKLSIDRINRLRFCSDQLKELISKYCSLDDFIDLEQKDLSAWRRSWRSFDFHEKLRADEAKREVDRLRGLVDLWQDRALKQRALLQQYATPIEVSGHEFIDDICRKCGCSRTFVEYFGGICSK